MKQHSWVLGVIAVVVALGLLVVGCTQENSETGTYDLEDGTYSARTEPDDHNWYAVNEITIKDRKIVKVNYDEVDAETGEVKGAAYDYQKAIEAQKSYEEQLVEKQDPDAVEVVSGATHTWENFKKTAKEALRISE